MVKSKLDDSIIYKETTELNEEDIQHDTTAFLIDYDGIDILVALGKEKYTYIKKEIIYIPIYLLHNSEVESQIGLYEVFVSDFLNITDGDADIDIDNLDEPIFFYFVNKKKLEK